MAAAEGIRRMKGRTPTIVLSLFLATGSLAFLPVSRASTDVPVWSVGDYWAYSAYGLALPFLPASTVKYDVVGTDIIAWQGASYAAYHTSIFANGSGTSLVHTGDAWFRTSDLALARLTLIISSACFIGFPPGCSSNSSMTQTLSQPLSLRFPLTPRDNWSASTTVTYEWVNLDNGTARWANWTLAGNFSVGSDTSMNVPAGNFTVTPLWENLSSSGSTLLLSYGERALVDYSLTVGNAVKETVYANPRGAWGPIAVLALTSYSHTQPWYTFGFLGIPVWAWVLVAAAAIVGVLVVLWRRRRPRPQPAVAPPLSPSSPEEQRPSSRT